MNLGWDILKVYSCYLIVTLIFIVLVLRACYYTFVIKQDPIKTFVPPDIGLWKIFNKEKKERGDSIKRSIS